jgi:GAF domain-containing protein
VTLQGVISDLLARTGASRCTLRQDVPGEVAFPVTHEALADGVRSLKELTGLDQRKQPVVIQILRERRQVVQHDSAAAFPDDPEFARMRRLYGGLAAQIVTPVLVGHTVAGVISLHQLGEPRRWSDAETELCRAAAAEVAAILAAGVDTA